MFKIGDKVRISSWDAPDAIVSGEDVLGTVVDGPITDAQGHDFYGVRVVAANLSRPIEYLLRLDQVNRR